MADDVAVTDILCEAMEYLSKLGANLRSRSESLKEKRIRKDRLKNAHAVHKAAQKVLTICELSKKSLDNVETGVKRILSAVSATQASTGDGGKTKKRDHGHSSPRSSHSSSNKPSSEKMDKHLSSPKSVYVSGKKYVLRFPRKLNVKHFQSVKVMARAMPKSFLEKYPVYYNCKLYRRREKKSEPTHSSLDKPDKVKKTESTEKLDVVTEKKESADSNVDSEAEASDKDEPSRDKYDENVSKTESKKGKQSRHRRKPSTIELSDSESPEPEISKKENKKHSKEKDENNEKLSPKQKKHKRIIIDSSDSEKDTKNDQEERNDEKPEDENPTDKNADISDEKQCKDPSIEKSDEKENNLDDKDKAKKLSLNNSDNENSSKKNKSDNISSENNAPQVTESAGDKCADEAKSALLNDSGGEKTPEKSDENTNAKKPKDINDSEKIKKSLLDDSESDEDNPPITRRGDENILESAQVEVTSKKDVEVPKQNSEDDTTKASDKEPKPNSEDDTLKPTDKEKTVNCEEDKELAKSSLLNDSSGSSTKSPDKKRKKDEGGKKSRRKHIMESMHAKKMLLTYSSSSDTEDEQLKNTIKTIKDNLLKNIESEDETTKSVKRKLLSSSESDEDVVKQLKKKRKMSLSKSPSPEKGNGENENGGTKNDEDCENENGGTKNDEDNTSKKSQDDSGGEKSGNEDNASKRSQSDSGDDKSNSSRRKMGRSREKPGASSSQNPDTQDDKDIEGLTNLKTLSKTRRRRGSDSEMAESTRTTSTRASSASAKNKKLTNLKHIKGEEGLVEASESSEASAVESEGQEEEDLPPISLPGLNGSGIEHLAKDDLLEESDSDSSKDRSSDVKNENDSDSDGPTTRRRKANTISSDSEVGSSSKKDKEVKMSDFEDSEDDSSEPVKKNKRKKKGSDSDASVGSSDGGGGKKKRKRIKQIDSDGSGSDSENEGKNKHGRKNIRKVMGKNQLEEATKKAAREEKERVARIAERQKLYNNLSFDESGKPDEVIVDKVVLDFDPSTKEPLIEVDRGLVKKLKPHQLAYMYSMRYNNLSFDESGKPDEVIVDKVVLDFDPSTKEPLIEVDRGLVKKLKPHQLAYMYSMRYNNLSFDESGKPDEVIVDKVVLDFDPSTKEPLIEVDRGLVKKLKPHQRYNNLSFDESGKPDEVIVDKVVLDFDPSTKEPLIEVDRGLVKKLKPHQLAYMYSMRYNNLSFDESGKPDEVIVDKVVLDFDPSTKEPLIEVDRGLVKKLKPHQLAYMYSMRYNNLSFDESGKPDEVIVDKVVLDFDPSTKEPLIEVDRGLVKKLKPHQLAYMYSMRYNNLSFDESGKPDEVIVDKVVLDFDPSTKEPLIEVDRGLVKKLKPHQANGIKFMWDACFESVKRIKKDKGSGCILAHCMGLGKTLQVVSLTHTLLTHSDLTTVERVLVVCPLSTVLNWVNEFNMWLKHADADYEVDVYELSKFKQNSERAFQLSSWFKHGGVCVLGYEMFRNLSADNPKKFKKKMLKQFQEALVDPGPDLVVCDEGHLLKNEKTSLSQSMNRVRTRRRIVLTGTPLQNNLKEYYCMVQFVKPNLLGKYNEYLNRFVNPITNGQYTDSTEHDIKIMKRRSHVLHNMLEGAVQRRDYGVLAPFLPPKHEYVLFITLTEVQIKLYQHYLDNYSRRPLPGKSSGFLFPDFQSMQRIWTHPLVLKYNSERYEIMQQKKRDREEEEDSEGSLADFIDDDSTPDETSSDDMSDSLSDASDDSRKKKKKKSSKKSKKEDKKAPRRGTRSNPNMEIEEVMPDPEVLLVKNDNPTEWWIPLVTDDEIEDMRNSNKLVLLFEILRQCEAIGDKLLVFSQSLYSLDLIEHFLGKVDEATQEGRIDEKLGGHVGSWSPGIDYFRLDGSTSCENRSIWCKNFNREDNPRARLFLISTRAGGLGINLVAANRVVIFDVSWNPSHDVQSIFRVYRFGQKKPCYIYRFLAMGLPLRAEETLLHLQVPGYGRYLLMILRMMESIRRLLEPLA
ncbi:transcriptional regulator ATRX [Phthorimaea operculella]|nr:transcriptional regulator ATRX [Phthorimaea operculella]